MRTLALIMAGGQGTRLFPLTRDRAKPAVPFGGKYRIVDFVLSNFVNSQIYSIYVLVQWQPCRCRSRTRISSGCLRWTRECGSLILTKSRQTREQCPEHRASAWPRWEIISLTRRFYAIR